MLGGFGLEPGQSLPCIPLISVRLTIPLDEKSEMRAQRAPGKHAGYGIHWQINGGQVVYSWEKVFYLLSKM